MRVVRPGAIVLALLAGQAAFAETVFIRDLLYVPLRGGQSTEHRIIHRGIPSGTRLELLETNEETGFSRVVTGDGLEGWLQTQYLQDEPIARDRLADLKGRIDHLEEREAAALTAATDSEAEAAALIVSNEALEAKNSDLRDELNRITRLAANVIDIDNENKRLEADNQALLEELDTLTRLNQTLSDDADQQWFLRGAGTVLVALLLGYWVGRRIHDRKDTGGWG